MSNAETFYSYLPKRGLRAVKGKGNVYDLMRGDEHIGQAKILRGEHCWAVVIRDPKREVRYAWKVSRAHGALDYTAKDFLRTALTSDYRVSSGRVRAVSNQRSNPINKLDWECLG